VRAYRAHAQNYQTIRLTAVTQDLLTDLAKSALDFRYIHERALRPAFVRLIAKFLSFLERVEDC
jgi:hypothetical protein